MIFSTDNFSSEAYREVAKENNQKVEKVTLVFIVVGKRCVYTFIQFWTGVNQEYVPSHHFRFFPGTGGPKCVLFVVPKT